MIDRPDPTRGGRSARLCARSSKLGPSVRADEIAGQSGSVGGQIGLGEPGRSQIVGEVGDPREWIYSWYRTFHFPLARFTRTQRWKLYADDLLYDIPADLHEENPIPPGFSQEARYA